MDLSASRRADRARPPRRWAASTTLGVLLASVPWSSTRSGEPQAPADAPKARVASAEPESKGGDKVLDAASAARKPAQAPSLADDPIARARHVIAECKAKYLTVQDYTCTFYKRERVDGKLYAPHIIAMKARTKPTSLYFKFIQPNKGREAIFIPGRHDDKIVAHDVGLGRVIAGTMHLDPRGDMAMEENRHPVTEAGIGPMIDQVKERWDTELHPGESVILFHPQKIGDRHCLMVESIHPKKTPEFMFHKVKLYVDREVGLPIRFESYDWPKHPGAEPELLEEYTFMNLKVNVGLKESDFDPNNRRYSYGRF